VALIALQKFNITKFLKIWMHFHRSAPETGLCGSEELPQYGIPSEVVLPAKLQ
jgi:hypothetical protein